MIAKANEKRRRENIVSLARMFMDIDKDQSGSLDRQEFLDALSMPKFITKLKVLDLTPDEASEVWELLDDGDGKLTVDEFTGGLGKMKGKPRAMDILDMLKR